MSNEKRMESFVFWRSLSGGQKMLQERDKEDHHEEDDLSDKRMHLSIDPDVLECSVCVGPLLPPLYQCINGHTACNGCRTKLQNKCPVCSRNLSHSRCLAFEKAIESIRIPCAHATFGCKKIIPFTNRSHEETCIHVPCCCPVHNCSVRLTTELMTDHLTCEHRLQPKRPVCDLYFNITFKRGEMLLPLQGKSNVLFLLLNDSDTVASMALFVACVLPISTKPCFSYELTTRSNGRIIGIEDSVAYLQRRSFVKMFLMVPQEFYESGLLPLHIRIRAI